MSDDQFQEFIAAIKSKPELLEKLRPVDTVSDLRAVAAELGFSISGEDLMDRVMNAYSELSDQELEQVAGGAAAKGKWGQSTVCTDMCKLTCGGTQFCPTSPETPKPI
ncbi:uncharacterized protein METZ01_LOCUS386977, partial [marine metagenome]